MKKNVVLSIILLFVFANLNLSAQAKNNFYYGLHMTPKYTVSIFDNKDISKADNQINYSLGLDFYIDLDNSKQFKTGLNYSHISFTQFDYSVQFPDDFTVANNNFEEAKFISFIEDDLQFHFVGIPVELILKLSEKPNHFYLKAGAEQAFLISKKSNSLLLSNGSIVADIDNLDVRSINKRNLNVKLGLGYACTFLQNSIFYFEPNIELGITKVFKSESSFSNNHRNLHLGITIGIIL